MNAPATMNKAEYARHRGCSDTYVSRLGKMDLLVMTPDGRVDVAKSDVLIAHHRDPARGGDRTATPALVAQSAAQGSPQSRRVQPAGGELPLGSADDSAYKEAARRERIAKARIAELELAEKAGQLVRREEVEAAIFGLARQAMESLDALADRLAPQLAAETDVDRIHALLTQHVRRIAGELANATRPAAAADQQQAA